MPLWKKPSLWNLFDETESDAGDASVVGKVSC